MRTIYKYELATTDQQTIRMPSGARIIACQVQRETPCLWAEVETESPSAARCFRIFGTGHPLDIDSAQPYIGTYQLHGGSLVFHVYEVVS